MTIAAVRAQARRYARVSSTQASDAQVNLLMQDSIDEMANDVDGFPTEAYLSIAAKFDTKTNYAVRVTTTGGDDAMAATDVLITGTARTGTTGTVVASDFQATLRSAIGNLITCTWANFAFTIDTLDATTITFDAPTDVAYVDARDLLGLPASPTLSDFSFTGNFPQDCTMEATIPSDAFKVERVEWDYNLLDELPPSHFMSPEASGDPAYYRVRGREIRLTPSPLRQKSFHIEYRGAPAALVFQGYQECGLSDKAETSATGLSNTTTYYYKVNINGAGVTEYSILTAANTTFSAVMALLNTANTGYATWSLVGGDLRLTSDAVAGASTIAVTAGTSGTDLLTTMSITMETAVAGDLNMPSEIPSTFIQAIPHLTASKLMEETQEKMSDKEYMKYYQLVNKYKSDYGNRNTTVNVGAGGGRFPRVSI